MPNSIDLNKFNCIYHVNFLDFPKIIFKKVIEGNLVFYHDYNLQDQLLRSELININDKNTVNKILIAEKWMDYIEVQEEGQKQLNPLPFDMLKLKKKIKSIGLVLQDNQTLWFDYDNYIITYKNIKPNDDSDRTLIDLHYFHIHETYIMSSFNDEILTEIMIKQ